MIDWIKRNKENIRGLITVIFLSLSAKFSGEAISKGIYVHLLRFGWFGFSSIKNQMSFCLNQTIIISALSALILGFLIDWLILKGKYNSLARKTFWILLLAMIIFGVISHYMNISAISPYTDAIYEQFKWAICY